MCISGILHSLGKANWHNKPSRLGNVLDMSLVSPPTVMRPRVLVEAESSDSESPPPSDQSSDWHSSDEDDKPRRKPKKKKKKAPPRPQMQTHHHHHQQAHPRYKAAHLPADDARLLSDSAHAGTPDNLSLEASQNAQVQEFSACCSVAEK